MKKRVSAQANIISTVLIILIVIIAVVIVWNVIYPLITQSTSNIESGTFTTRFDIEQADLYVTGDAKIRVKRETGKGDITELRFIFYDEDGESHIVSETENLPDELETKNYYYNVSEIFRDDEVKALKSVGVIPVFGKNLGIEFSPIQPNSQAVPDGLVSWWKFDGNAKDSAGENDGKFFGDAKTEEGVLVLDGDGDYVEFINTIIMSNDNSVISWWMKRDSLDYEAIFVYHQNGCSGQIEINDDNPLLPNNIRIESYQNNLWHSYFDTKINTADNIFHMYSLVFGEENVKLYIDGILSNTSLIGADGEIKYNYIGLNQAINYGDYFNGEIDNVMIFNKVLSEEEIKAIYENQRKN